MGAFSPFYRSHASDDAIFQEFYRWESVVAAARKAIALRYQLLDYFYAALWRQSVDGTPLLNLMFYLYPNDHNTFGIDLQYFYGTSILVSPGTEGKNTSFDAYFPQDIFDLWTYAPVQGTGANIAITHQGLTDIPLHVRGGVILPMRVSGANTTTTLRTKDFMLLPPIGADGTAGGELYLDKGDAILQPPTSHITFKYPARPAEDGQTVRIQLLR